MNEDHSPPDPVYGWDVASSLRPPDTREFRDARGRLEVSVLAPGIVFQRAEGHASAEIASKLRERLDELVARFGKIELFDDWYEMKSYDSEARRIIERWTLTRKASVTGIHVLLSSKMVAMAISVSNLMNGGVTVAYNDRAAFERVMKGALERAK